MGNRYRATIDPNADNNPHSYALQLVGSGHRVLEVGCASGHVSEHLVAAGNDVTGLEIDPIAAADARQVIDIVHEVDLDHTPASTVVEGRFDVILLGDVLEHTRDPQAVLTDLVDLLDESTDDGGRLIVSVPNMAHIDVRLHLLEGEIRYQDDGLLDRTHLRWFTKSQLRDLLDSVGFVATDVRRVTVPLGGSLLPITPAIHDDAVFEFVRADPEAETYQYVVEARRRDHLAEDADGDLLADSEFERPTPRRLADLEARNEELRSRVAALEAEVTAWEQSRIVRLTTPLRALSGRIQRALSS